MILCTRGHMITVTKCLFRFCLVQDYDYYDRYDDGRDLFDRRYSGMGNSGMRGKAQSHENDKSN